MRNFEGASKRITMPSEMSTNAGQSERSDILLVLILIKTTQSNQVSTKQRVMKDE